MSSPAEENTESGSGGFAEDESKTGEPSNRVKIGFGLIALIPATLLLVIIGYIIFQINSDQSSSPTLLLALASAASALGTLSLAYFTYDSVLQSRAQGEEHRKQRELMSEQLEEMKRDRRQRERRELRGHIEDILTEVVKPAMNSALANDLSMVMSGFTGRQMRKLRRRQQIYTQF